MGGDQSQPVRGQPARVRKRGQRALAQGGWNSNQIGADQRHGRVIAHAERGDFDRIVDSLRRRQPLAEAAQGHRKIRGYRHAGRAEQHRGQGVSTVARGRARSARVPLHNKATATGPITSDTRASDRATAPGSLNT